MSVRPPMGRHQHCLCSHVQLPMKQEGQNTNIVQVGRFMDDRLSQSVLHEIDIFIYLFYLSLIHVQSYIFICIVKIILQIKSTWPFMK